MFYVYAISSLKHIYVGLTKNIDNRLKRHNDGRERTTKFYRPFILIYSEVCETRPEARSREIYWKSGTGKEKLRSIRGSF